MSTEQTRAVVTEYFERICGVDDFTVGDEELVGLVYFEVADGLIARVTDFWPEPYEAPPGREHLTELGAVGLDRLSSR